MKQAQQEFLILRRLPIFVDRTEAGHLLGREPHEIAILERAGFLKPCGRPPKNGKIMYSSAAILKLGDDPKTLDRMADAIYRHWKKANQKGDEESNAGGE